MEETTEDDVLICVNYREKLIARTRKLVDMSNNRTKVVGVIARELVNLEKELRLYGLRCVEKIISWTLSNTPQEAEEPVCFLFEGEDYLRKMLRDLDFVCEELKEQYHHSFNMCDPIFIKAESCFSASDHRRGLAATFVILDACARYEKKNPSSVEEEDDDEEEDEGSLAPHKASVHMLRYSHNLKNKITFKKRQGLHDIYEFQNNQDSANKTQNRKKAISKIASLQDIIVFKGNMLYQRGKLLGEGAYAKVYECDRQDGTDFAVKCFDLNLYSKRDDEDMAYTKTCYYREVDTLKKLCHPNIIEIEETVVRNGMPFVILEKMSCTLLQLQVDRSKSFITTIRYSIVEEKAIQIMLQISDALRYMHEMGIMHRDIKPENILLIPRGDVTIAKIGDLGSAIDMSSATSGHLKGDLTHYVGSRWYRAPELLGCSSEYGFECDAWALGCTMGEFIRGSPLFVGEAEQDVLDEIITYFNPFDYPPNMDSSFQARGLIINETMDKKNITVELGSASSVTLVLKSAICLNPEHRYSPYDIWRDCKEIQVEMTKLKETSGDEQLKSYKM